MSYYWNPWCETCDECGPPLRSGTSPHLRMLVNRETNEHVDTSAPLKQWLDQHEYHRVVLLNDNETPERYRESNAPDDRVMRDLRAALKLALDVGDRLLEHVNVGTLVEGWYELGTLRKRWFGGAKG